MRIESPALADNMEHRADLLMEIVGGGEFQCKADLCMGYCSFNYAVVDRIKFSHE